MTKITRKNTAAVFIDRQVSPEFSMQAPHSIPSHLMAPTVTCCGLTSGNRPVLIPSARTGCRICRRIILRSRRFA
jgi:hypothetical protein